MKLRIKKDDTVVVRTGKDRGKTGKVLRTLPDDRLVIIEGVNIVNRRERARKSGKKGQTVQKAMPIDISNVLLSCSSCKRGVRVGVRMDGTTKVRVCKRCGNKI